MNPSSATASNERTPFLCQGDESSSSSNNNSSSCAMSSRESYHRRTFLAVGVATLGILAILSSFQNSNSSSAFPGNSNIGVGKHDHDDGLSMSWTSSEWHSASASSSQASSASSFHQGASKLSQTKLVTSDAEDSKDMDTMSFDEYLSAFGKHYESETDYKYRKSIYESNQQLIRSHNLKSDEHGWTMGLNQFADLLPDEIPKGFDKGLPHGPNSDQQMLWGEEDESASHPFSSIQEQQQHGRNLRFSVHALPESVDWRSHEGFPIVTPVKDQGGCGSCWAFAATAVLESHVALATQRLMVLSPQELVSCAPNPDHCGGDGGCSGSTGEMAYDYVSKKGMVTEWSYGYTSYHGETGTCQLKENPLFGYVKGAKVGLVGYSSLPTNSYDALMYAVANLGPVVVSVAASTWGPYRGGIFDDFDATENYDINHAVVLEGYGTDPDSGQDYWLVRNSWGVLWGEEGYIRLKRSRMPSMDSKFFRAKDHCKLDVTPSHGVSCEGPDGNATIPDQLVCGTSGILYANVVPVGAHLLV